MFSFNDNDENIVSHVTSLHSEKSVTVEVIAQVCKNISLHL